MIITECIYWDWCFPWIIPTQDKALGATFYDSYHGIPAQSGIGLRELNHLFKWTIFSITNIVITVLGSTVTSCIVLGACGKAELAGFRCLGLVRGRRCQQLPAHSRKHRGILRAVLGGCLETGVLLLLGPRMLAVVGEDHFLRHYSRIIGKMEVNILDECRLYFTLVHIYAICTDKIISEIFFLF